MDFPSEVRNPAPEAAVPMEKPSSPWPWSAETRRNASYGEHINSDLTRNTSKIT
jgi:hypothetical protein